MEAGLDEVGAKGIAHLTMTGVCRRAGLTERYFYESFSNREALLVALLESMFEEYFLALIAEIDGTPPDLLSRARLAVRIGMDVVTRDPRKARLYAETIGHESVRKVRTDAVRRAVEFGADQAESVIGLKGPKQRARFVLAAMTIANGQIESIVSWVNGDIPLSRDEYVETNALLFLSAAENAKKPRAKTP